MINFLDNLMLIEPLIYNVKPLIFSDVAQIGFLEKTNNQFFHKQKLKRRLKKKIADAVCKVPLVLMGIFAISHSFY